MKCRHPYISKRPAIFRYTLMMRCWEEETSERPPFEDIRSNLREMLNVEDEYYGYVTLENPKSVRYMLNREVGWMLDYS